MRTVFVSLIAAAGLVSTAQAQPAADPAAMPMPAAPAADPMAPAPTAVPAPAAVAPAAVPAPAAVAPAPPPPPPLPTEGDGAAVLSVLDKVCTPAVRGGSLDALAKAAGFKFNKRQDRYLGPLGADKNYLIAIRPQGSNKDVCIAEIRFAVGQEAPIVSAVHAWSISHQPELFPAANYVATDADNVKRVRRSYENFTANASAAVNFTVLRKPDDTPLNPRYDSGEVYYQERKF